MPFLGTLQEEKYKKRYVKRGNKSIIEKNKKKEDVPILTHPHNNEQ